MMTKLLDVLKKRFRTPQDVVKALGLDEALLEAPIDESPVIAHDDAPPSPWANYRFTPEMAMDVGAVSFTGRGKTGYSINTDAFEEGKHPRDHGKFSSGSGGGGASGGASKTNWGKSGPPPVPAGHSAGIGRGSTAPRGSSAHQVAIHGHLNKAGYHHTSTSSAGTHHYWVPHEHGRYRVTVNRGGGVEGFNPRGMQGAGRGEAGIKSLLS